ncbi:MULTISPECIES: vWA domain-containing protein [unclassified Pseudoalteromonas]|uniref:vWA domain-containing protein n=1 Tax=unclassified Pseudoalteromonas TaxID=194690 RepID=UPI001F1B0C1A|nr:MULTISPECIES: VWA domain-containing protein [unclassified Pseudoalteromonas]MCF2825988.1 VWA domain-containing protein [Pseudoalteromonas sp. OF5H-5]MCF2830010.1 VWA domain-containing protein [Pseudoalteromonas sp. DL2-H6]MCF2927670.1 VWA domain-containing protein [Pseudoalteromonas sp. DL2-H1]
MLIDFVLTLRRYGIKASLRELLDCLEALDKEVCFADLDGFYVLAKTIFVKDETLFDKFDRAFADYFEGIESIDLFSQLQQQQLPEDWLRKEFEKSLSEEEKAKLNAMGGLDKLLETLKARLAEQQKRHAGGNKWVGTGGTSPFGAYGYNPEGIRIGQDGNRHRRAVKVWDKRQYRNLDSNTDISSRNIKLALKQLRKFARSGASDQLDLNETIRATARQGGMLDVKMAPERHNSVKVLMLFDIGGSMDDHIQLCEQLFSAAHSEFKHLEFFYFHNCVYEHVWHDNDRRDSELLDTYQLINRYGSDYRLIFVGDATMGPYEITYPGGSVEHWNQEAGATWLNRLTNHFSKVAWLNPQPQSYWSYYHSIELINQLMQDRMYPLTIEGLSQAFKELS